MIGPVDHVHVPPSVFNIRMLRPPRGRIFSYEDIGAKGGGFNSFSRAICLNVLVEPVETGSGDGKDGAFVGEEDRPRTGRRTASVCRACGGGT